MMGQRPHICQLFAILLIIGTSGTANADSPYRENSTANPPSIKFSLGGVISVTSNEETRGDWAGDTDEYHGFLFNLINPTFNARFLFPVGNNLSMGFGGDITVSLYGYALKEEPGYHSPLELPLPHVVIGSGTLAPYGIIGYDNLYLHLGFDFVWGALYISPSFAISENLLLGIQMSLFGSNMHGLASLIAPPRRKASPPEPYHDMKVYQIGYSLQYVF